MVSAEHAQSPAPDPVTPAPIVPASDDSNKPTHVGETEASVSTAPATSANESTDPKSVNTSDLATVQEPLNLTTPIPALAPQSDISKDLEPQTSNLVSNSWQSTPPTGVTRTEIPIDICPAWAKPALENFIGIAAGENWNALLASWITFEVEVGVEGVCYHFLCPFCANDSHIQKLPTKGRPEEVGWWMKQKRPLSNAPVIDAGEFGAQWQTWWTAMQPEWRTLDAVWPFPHVIPAEGSWGRLEHSGGSNGMFLVVLTLSWWARAVSQPSDTKFNLAVKDVTWMLDAVNPNTMLLKV